EEDGIPIPGVNVMVNGSIIGTVSDLEGKYLIDVPDKDGVLIFSFIGLVTKEVEIGNQSVINVIMKAYINALTEIVAGALDIPRNKATLGYATQALDNEAVSMVKEYNFINSLSGKISGAQIRQNATMGGSTNIILRGYNFINGDNQPLFVVDGIPIDNSTHNDVYQITGRRGYDYGNAASDINPDDIETINVLKGASAAALYGSRGANGAIIISTKKGKESKGLGIDFSTTFLMGKIDKSTFISYQDQYGAGYGPYYGSTGYFNEYDVNGDGIDDLVVPTAEDASYGARFEDYSGTPIWQWDSFWPESENYGKPYEYKAGETTPVDFFETSHTITNSIALRGGSETNTFRFGYTNWITSGILPNSSIIRHNFSLNASNQLSERLKATVLLNFIKNNTTGRYGTGCFCNAISQFRKWWQVNVDVGQLKNLYEKSGGLNRTWNIKNPSLIPDEADLAPAYSDNPYWTRYKNYSTDGRTRTMGKISLTYNILDWLSLMGRITVDSYSELREERRAIGSVPEEFGISKMDEESGYLRRDLLSREYNLDLILTAKKNISKNVSLFGILGTNFRRNNFVWNEQSTSGGLVVPELYALSNSAGPLPVPVEVERRKEVYGYFTNLNIGYRNFLYLDLAGRLDISSALPTNNNTYPFGSVSLAWIFTQNLNVNWLSFGKARLSYAEVGNDIQANTTSDIFQQNSNFGDAVLFSAPSYKANSALKPERLASWEAGLEMGVFNGRARLDLAFYRTSATNQMIEVATSLATGYWYKYISGGEIVNNGFELTIGGDIVRSDNLSWSMDINWAKNK
ncbi:MAG: SusC/RagA family TonB-linked outer membrane protein, partial [Cyclobacteriaceae bacterium]|nr:SusC/RagA family TonB-linked outer membrane protein [Cyclobacteriaceae bacterium]